MYGLILTVFSVLGTDDITGDVALVAYNEFDTTEGCVFQMGFVLAEMHNTGNIDRVIDKLWYNEEEATWIVTYAYVNEGPGEVIVDVMCTVAPDDKA